MDYKLQADSLLRFARKVECEMLRMRGWGGEAPEGMEAEKAEVKRLVREMMDALVAGEGWSGRIFVRWWMNGGDAVECARVLQHSVWDGITWEN
jgi:hypothetical protein